MNEQLTEEWIDSVVSHFAFGRRLLSWDSFRCHISDSVRDKLKAFNVDAVVVPGGCTKYIQAPDVSWNKPFKAAVTEKYGEWLAKSVNDLTPAGNPEAPPRKNVVEWILHGWAQLDPELIRRSFKACALTIPTDGSQDNNIHCFKADQPCHAGLEKLQSLNDIVTGPRANPFAGISVVVNLNDEAEMEYDPVNVISDDSGSDAEDIDIEH